MAIINYEHIHVFFCLFFFYFWLSDFAYAYAPSLVFSCKFWENFENRNSFLHISFAMFATIFYQVLPLIDSCNLLSY